MSSHFRDTTLAVLGRIFRIQFALSVWVSKFEAKANWLMVEKRQRAGAVQDAGANDCGSRMRKASWTAVALYRSYVRVGNNRLNERDVALSRSLS